MKSKIILFVAAALVLSGCSGPKVKIQETYNKDAGEGMVVGTLCIENKNYTDYTFKYSDDVPSINDYPNDSNMFTIQYGMPHFVVNKKAYFLFSIVKPAGKYKYYRVQALNYVGQEVKKLDVDMDIKFDVVPGKTTYLGQINVNVDKKEFSVEDQIERDRTWFAKKVPQIQF